MREFIGAARSGGMVPPAAYKYEATNDALVRQVSEEWVQAVWRPASMDIASYSSGYVVDRPVPHPVVPGPYRGACASE